MNTGCFDGRCAESYDELFEVMTTIESRCRLRHVLVTNIKNFVRIHT